MQKVAVCQVADTGPLESLVVMLRSAGYECVLPTTRLKERLRSFGCDTVLNIDDLVRGMGYEHPVFKMREVDEEVLKEYGTIYVDVKAHRNLPRIVKHWPWMNDRTLWYRINGGKPEHVVNARGDHGDEVNPPCPIVTPNQWYDKLFTWKDKEKVDKEHHPWGEWARHNAYTCWPPFVRMKDHAIPRPSKFQSPMCLIHNLEGWGYGKLVEPFREMGVRCFGAGSPDGLVEHREIPVRLSNTLCMVHLKSSDAPGYALYEALASACPVVCTRRLIWRNRMEDLLIPGETCLVFDRETHDALSDEDVVNCCAEVRQHLVTLQDPRFNRRIGEAGRKRLAEVQWSEERDGAGFKAWMERMFP